MRKKIIEQDTLLRQQDQDYLALNTRLLNVVNSYNLLKSEYTRLQGNQTHNFTKDELRDLRKLCHPDKHNNSDLATQLTAKINGLL